MILRDTLKKQKTTLGRKLIIDNVTQLYVSIIKQDEQIEAHEINILYSLLINIFRRETISWEVYIREIVNTDIKINHVISYLNQHLLTIDKIRILLSLIIMSNTNNDFSNQLTQILNIAKKFDLKTEWFHDIFTNLENKSLEHISLEVDIFKNNLENSIFSDYLFFGRDEKCQIQFRDLSVNSIEFVLFMIDQYIVIATNTKVSSLINENQILPSELYLFPRHSTIKINNIEFNYEILAKLYKNQGKDDVIDFKRTHYSFSLINNNNKISLHIDKGEMQRNGEVIPKNRNVFIYYDDELWIKGHNHFNLLDLINTKVEIVLENIIPNVLFIEHQADFYSINVNESAKSIVRIEIDNHKHIIHPSIRKSYELFLNNKKITEPILFHLNTDIISINKKNFRINNFYDLVEIPFELENISVLDIKHYFPDSSLALDGVSFEITKGELLAILGQSGCGKSSLLKAICGEILPTYGSIMYDGKDYYQNMSFFSQHVGYVPQDDILFAHLTVYENLFFRGKLRIHKITDDYLDQKINKILINTNLIHKKNTKVGDLKNKLLSGGERKRLNLALELLFDPTVIICDEPTSGLSYTDAEQVIDILKDFSQQGKFVIITIHQPNTTVFHKFNRVLFMDMGGKQVYFGKPNDVWSYFDNEYQQVTHKKDLIEHKKLDKMPEYVSLMIEYPEYKENGELAYEKIARNITIKRKFTPEYWRDKYKKKMLFDLIQFDNFRGKTNKTTLKHKIKKDFFSLYTQLIILIRRNFTTKIRNKLNMIITFGQVILLATIISFILRLAPIDQEYSFHQNTNIGIFIFISVIIFIFLGMSNSMEEILSERKNFIREKMLNIKVRYFLISKIAVLSLFSAIQILVYLFISCHILSITGMHFIYFIFLFLSSLVGSSIGVFISSFLSDSKSIINIIPLILIPQIIFGGAIIEFDKMNRNILLLKSNPIPEIVYVMPSYWLFEGLYVSQAKLNKHDRAMNKIDKRRAGLIKNHQSTTILYEKVEEININYPRKVHQNEYLNLSVNLMDGRLNNTQNNVFLASSKLLGKSKIPTYVINPFIILFFVLFINTASVFKLKFFYKEKGFK